MDDQERLVSTNVTPIQATGDYGSTPSHPVQPETPEDGRRFRYVGVLSVPGFFRRQVDYFREANFKWCCLSLVIFAVLLVSSGIITPIALVATDHCEGLSFTTRVYPGDPILAGKITSCQTNAFLKSPQPPNNNINTYSLSCGDLHTSHEQTNDEFSFENLNDGIPVISEQQDFSNYYVEGTEVELILQINSENGSDVYSCFFSSSDAYGLFLSASNAKEFSDAVKQGNCDVSHETHNVSFKATQTGYHYAAVAPYPGQNVESVNVRVLVNRTYYEPSDFQNLTGCTLSEETHTCSVNQTTHSSDDTCVILYAIYKDEGNDFSTVDVSADKRPLTQSPGFVPTVAVMSSFGVLCVAAFVVSVGVFVIKNKRHSARA